MQNTHSPPKARAVQYKAPLGTRWEKERANIPRSTFELASDPHQIGPWILGECIGKGASGRVKVARHYETGQMAAVKILPLENVLSSRHSLHTRATKAEKHRNGIDREIIMMKLMDHPNVVRIYDVFEGERDLFLVLEYVDGGELFDYLVNHGRMEPQKALRYFKQIIHGLSYAHAFAVIHRDLKPENILIASLDPPHIKIADWGMAAFAPPEYRLETSCGSPHYASPEIVRGEQYSGTATDIWSCGVILFALMTGRLPFDDKSIRALLLKVKSGKFEIPSYVFPEAADLIRRMLVVDVDKRITMSDILNHPFLARPTPGTVCISAPSISELDRPVRSRALIKQDLLSSLLLICGGSTHDEIVEDLLSPPDQGSLTKALYFLLAKHREQTLEAYGMQSLFYNDGQHIRHYTAPPMKEEPKSPSDMVVDPANTVPAGHPSHPLHLQASRLAPKPPPRVLAKGPVYEPESPTISAPNSRVRPTSPSGPRTPRSSQVHKVRPASTPAAARGPCNESGGSIVKIPKRTMGAADNIHVSTPAIFPNDASPCRPTRPRTRTVDGLPYSEQRYDPAAAMSPRGSPRDLYLGSPRVQAQAPVLPPLDVTIGNGPMSTPGVLCDMPWAEKPEVEDPILRRTLDDVERSIGVLIMEQQKQGLGKVGLGIGAPDTGVGILIPADASSTKAVDEDHGIVSSKKLRLGTDNARTPAEDFKYNMSNKKTVNLMQRVEGGDHDKENTNCAASPASEIGSSRISAVETSRNRHPSIVEEDTSYTKIEKMEVESEVAAAGARMAAAQKRPRARRATSQRGSQIANRRHTHTISEPANHGALLTTPSLAVGEVKCWFANLFNWKAQQYILHSVDNCLATRDEAVRVLQALGCQVALEDAQGWGVLKCRMDEKFGELLALTC